VKRIVSSLMWIFLVADILILASNIQPIMASGTIYIRADGSVDPIDAPISSLDNVTYTLTSNVSGCIVIERNNILIDGAQFTVQGIGNGTGIDLTSRTNVTIKNVEISAFYYGICINASSSITISGNNVTANMGIGIYLEDSNDSVVFENLAIGNLIGTCIDHSLGNVFSHNGISYNSVCGIDLYSSYNNTITDNSIFNNNNGVYLAHSSNNTFFHNNLINNSRQVSFSSWSEPTDPPSINIWNSTYSLGGNYWSEYWSADMFQGPYQNETGGEGIGDQPYEIDQYNYDNYPFMQQDGWSFQITHEHDIVVSMMQAPSCILPEAPTTISAVIRNLGFSHESNIHVQLLVEGTLYAYSLTPQLASMSSIITNFPWISPQTENIYNLTIHAVPVPGEDVTNNNSACKFVEVSYIEPHDGNAIWIQPSTSSFFTDTVSFGYRFNVTVWINLTVSSGSWSFKLVYEKNLLSVTRCVYTAGSKSEFYSNISTFGITPAFMPWNSTHNSIYYGECVFGEPCRNPGYGSLAWIEFEVINVPADGVTWTSLLSFVGVYPDDTETFAQEPDQSYIALDADGSIYRIIGVVLIGDVNGDGKVRIDDILAIVIAFGSNCGDPEYDPNTDINKDCKIRIDDILIAVQHFGEDQ